MEEQPEKEAMRLHSDKLVLSLDMSYRAYFCEVSENRTGEPLSVAALMLKQERSADRAGSGTMGGFLLRRGQTTTFQERLDITERATVGPSDSEIAATLGCSIWMVRQPQSYTAQEGDSDMRPSSLCSFRSGTHWLFLTSAPTRENSEVGLRLIRRFLLVPFYQNNCFSLA